MNQELGLKLMQTNQGDWLSWIFFLIFITIMQFYANKLQAQLWINEIRKALVKLEEYTNDAANKFIEEASKYAITAGADGLYFCAFRGTPSENFESIKTAIKKKVKAYTFDNIYELEKIADLFNKLKPRFIPASIIRIKTFI